MKIYDVTPVMSPSSRKNRTSRKTKTSRKIKTLRKTKTSRSTKVKKRASRKRTMNVLFIHDNKTPGHTTKVHKLAEEIDKDPNYNVIYDKKFWKPGERTSLIEINQREKEMVSKADRVIRVVAPPSKTGRKRSEGSIREYNKTMNAGKPIAEIYERGAKTSPNRPIREKNYRNRVQVHLKPKQKLKTGFKEAMEKIDKLDSKNETEKRKK